MRAIVAIEPSPAMRAAFQQAVPDVEVRDGRAEAIPEPQRPDALHQLFYGFYSRVAVVDRTTHDLARIAPSGNMKPVGRRVRDVKWDEAQLEIKRKTLVVRLHRMVQAGRLSSQAHGHYTLSEAERSRRRA